jgi:hypothetical protein
MKKAFAILLMGASAAGFTINATAASSQAKATYNAAKDQAAADYKTARAACDSLTGNPKDVCVAQAKAARIHVEAEAKAEYKNTLSAHTHARKVIADADYDVNKTKCGSQTGNAKDVCIEQAKSAKIAAVADASADKKIIETRNDATDDKRDADYKVALQKCDAFAGAAHDTCVTNAKTQFNK